MDHVCAAQSRCRAAVARGDITPPVGIYHRLWGAALHDRAASVHRPLLATALLLEALTANKAPRDRLLLVALDHCLLDRDEIDRIRVSASLSANLTPEQVHVTVSHTHAAGWMSRSRANLPGGDLIGPYLDTLNVTCANLARTAAQQLAPATIVYGHGRCGLAAQRDYWDENTRQFVCGFNPRQAADDTVLVGRITRDDGQGLATLVNYACHPTTLAWENTAISPDYVGSLREVVEGATQAPCLFLQGASGDLGPREGFVGDPAVADRNGRQLGYAVLAVLEGLDPPGTHFVYTGPVVSGAILGTWKHQVLGPPTLEQHALWRCRRVVVDLPYRVDLPTIEESRAQQAFWRQEEDRARAGGDKARLRDCRARVEQMTRQIGRLSVLPQGKTFPFAVTLCQLGGALWLLTPGELYSAFQVMLRHRLAPYPVVIATMTDDWQPGYLPPAASYGLGIYQEGIAIVGPGALEVLLETVARAAATILQEAAADR